ncbi:hypothetical protein [Rhodoligotrophos ferricapiens]|uniref:hypothetical protein n=1 Tax=Rhodoligotrophos ferricapiens TaxID=3069264 RepID=UPI00315D6F8D
MTSLVLRVMPVLVIGAIAGSGAAFADSQWQDQPTGQIGAIPLGLESASPTLPGDYDVIVDDVGSGIGQMEAQNPFAYRQGVPANTAEETHYNQEGERQYLPPNQSAE